jgi:hypothetical protein
MSKDDETEKAIKLLKILQDNLTVEQGQLVTTLANVLKSIRTNQDYEGVQIFPIKDYKRRN